LRGLPLKADEQEAKTRTSRLCDAIEAGDEGILGPGFSNIPEILRVFAEVFSSAITASASGNEEDFTPAHPQTVARMQAIVKHLVGGGAGAVAQGLSQQAYGSLTQRQQECLQQAMV